MLRSRALGTRRGTRWHLWHYHLADHGALLAERAAQAVEDAKTGCPAPDRRKD